MATNLMQTGADWLSTMRKAYAAGTATCQRGSEVVTIASAPIPIDYEQQEAGGAIIAAQRWDWIVTRAELVFGGVATEPQEGDLFVRTIGTRTETFEAQPAGTVKHFEPLDSDGKSFVVHTRRVQ